MKIVIGISGTLCSGKGLVAEILKSKGCDVTTLGAIVRESLNSQGIETTRENQQNEGNRLRKEYGGQILAQKALERYAESNAPLVIDGIRNISEIEYLEKNSKFYLIAVDALLDIRFGRSNKRNRDPHLGDYDIFKMEDERDRGLNEPENGQQVGKCMDRADFRIINDDEFIILHHSKVYKETIKIYDEIVGR
jgi:dephospho-CoA kinase